MKRSTTILTLALFGASSLLADFSYEQTSKVTGGAMASMMKFAGAFSKQMREPMKNEVLVKGDRMAHVGLNSIQVIDLSKETITQIDTQKKTYSVLTFAQFTEAINRMTAKMRDQKGNEAADLTIKPSVKETGTKKLVAGHNCRQVVLTIEMWGKDKKTGQDALFMTMISDMWLASDIAGYKEVRDFYQRMATKMSWAPGMTMMAPPAGSQKGMAEMMKEMSKLDGVPVYQVMSMGGMGGAAAQGEGGQAAPPPQQQQQEQAEKPSTGGALGKIAGGRFGGLGGFGRKKKQEEPPAEQQPAAQGSNAPAQQQGGPSGAPGSLMELTSEMTNFSTAGVDASKFEVPAGFKQVESDMLKHAK